MSILGFNGIIDISHWQNTPSTTALANAEIVAVIAKATQGRGNKDSTYWEKKMKLKGAGLKWGAYHFSSSSAALLQVDNFLDYAKPESDELMALDYEPSSSGANMTYDQMIEFVELVKQATGRYPVIYGGHLLRETLQHVPAQTLAASALVNCPLWYARYSATPIGIPAPWQTWTLWQYSDGNLPQGLSESEKIVPKFGRCDRDTYNGSRADLLSNWPLT